MRKIALLGLVMPLLAACGTSSAAQPPLTQEKLACADAGVDPSSPALGQCAADLKWNIWYQEEGPASR